MSKLFQAPFSDLKVMVSPPSVHSDRSSNQAPHKRARRHPPAPSNSLRFFLLSQEAILAVFPYLTTYELMALACVCRTLKAHVYHPSLWGAITLTCPPSLPSPQPLLDLTSRASHSFPTWFLSVRGAEHFPHSHIAASCPSLSPCTDCSVLSELRLPSLLTLVLEGLPWLSNNHLHALLDASPSLRSLDITQNIDVNALFLALGQGSHPDLQFLSFRHFELLDLARDPELDLDCPTLSPQTILRTAPSLAPSLRFLSLKHFVLTDDSAYLLLRHLPLLQGIDFSDNESLTGSFLSSLVHDFQQTPSFFREHVHLEEGEEEELALCPHLREIHLRTCTLLADDELSQFAESLVTHPTTHPLSTTCLFPSLVYVDTSCEYSDSSFLPDDLELKGELEIARPGFVWREDQVDIEGFGFDEDEEGVEQREYLGMHEVFQYPSFDSEEEEEDEEDSNNSNSNSNSNSRHRNSSSAPPSSSSPLSIPSATAFLQVPSSLTRPSAPHRLPELETGGVFSVLPGSGETGPRSEKCPHYGDDWYNGYDEDDEEEEEEEEDKGDTSWFFAAPSFPLAPSSSLSPPPSPCSSSASSHRSLCIRPDGSFAWTDLPSVPPPSTSTSTTPSRTLRGRESGRKSFDPSSTCPLDFPNEEKEGEACSSSLLCINPLTARLDSATGNLLELNMEEEEEEEDDDGYEEDDEGSDSERPPSSSSSSLRPSARPTHKAPPSLPFSLHTSEQGRREEEEERGRSWREETKAFSLSSRRAHNDHHHSHSHHSHHSHFHRRHHHHHSHRLPFTSSSSLLPDQATASTSSTSSSLSPRVQYCKRPAKDKKGGARRDHHHHHHHRHHHHNRWLPSLSPSHSSHKFDRDLRLSSLSLSSSSSSNSSSIQEDVPPYPRSELHSSSSCPSLSSFLHKQQQQQQQQQDQSYPYDEEEEEGSLDSDVSKKRKRRSYTSNIDL